MRWMMLGFAAFSMGCGDDVHNDPSGGTGGAGNGTGGGGAATASSSGGAGDCLGCCAAEPGAATASWYVTLSTKLNPQKPIVFLADIAATDAGVDTALTMTLQPLAAADRATPVGGPIDAGTHGVSQSDGTFVADLPQMTVPAEANPISDTEITATVDLSGTLCSDPTFVCGDLNGQVTQPIMLDLEGSTFTMQRVTNPAELPDAVINCTGDVAPP